MKKFFTILLAMIFAGNIFASNVHAEIKSYTANNTALLDFGDEDSKAIDLAKNVAKLRAIKSAFEKAGFFALSFVEETLNGNLTDDDISALTREYCEIEDTKFERFFFNAKNDKGEYYGRPGYIYEATVSVKIDTEKISNYMQLDANSKQKLIEQDKNAKKNFEEIDTEFENLRKTAANKTQSQIKSELEKINNKISEQNKPVEQKNVPMIFSQLVEIGRIGYPPEGNMIIENATYISSQSNGKSMGTFTYPYDTDIKFNDGEDSIFVHHKSGYKSEPNFGDENINNSILVDTGLYGIVIYQLKNNSSIKFYLLMTLEADASFTNWVCIGKKNGKWIKYFDLKDIRKKYFGDEKFRHYYFALSLEKKSYNNYTYPIIYCKNDTIVMEYQKYESSTNSYTKGEFRFKWDEKAQWFGVEKVTY